MAIFWKDSSGAGSVGEERAMKRERELREIMEQAIEEMREVLSQETEEGRSASSGTRTPGRKRWSGLPGGWANGWCKLGVR